MARQSDSDPQVREASYTGADLGPPEDTGTFYKGTPAPGQRVDLAPAAAGRAADGERLPRSIARTPTSSGMSGNSSLPILVGALAGVLVVGVFGVMLWVFGRPDPVPPPPPPAVQGDASQQPDDGKWEGIEVKKGLK